ncbi:MAG: hypothetical protein IT259_06580 [Saprospiraceae bacterium]|nr:hypothetical protein [Saprospiraceae bacterium]
MPHRLFLLFALLPALLPAQPFIDDHVIFWDSADWDRTEVVYYYPQQQAVPLAIRWYYGDRRDIREEFIRIDGDRWLFNSRDTTGAWHFRRGPMRPDLEHPQIDSTLTFDPDSYGEIVQIDTNWRLIPEGYWQEADSAGFFWSGYYADGQKQGVWTKIREIRPKVYDWRSIHFSAGRPGPEKQHNLALSGDTTSIYQALYGSWVYCDDSHQLTVWRNWNGPPPRNAYAHHGSWVIWFMPDHRAQKCTPSSYQLNYLTLTGSWSLSDNGYLHFNWDNGTSESFRLRSLMDGEMLLDMRK